MSLSPEQLAASIASGFKADLGGEIRHALPGVPDSPIVRDLIVPRAAELRFLYGLQRGVRVPVSFRVTVLVSGRAKELFEGSLTPERAGGSWRYGSVDLAPWAGDRITLRLETSAAGDLDPEQGLPLWGDTEVVALQ